MKAAAIDLGSNSFICLIFEFNAKGELVTLDDRIILTRLSEGVDKTKEISKKALERSKEAFQEFEKIFIKHGITNIQAVATSAARDSKNQKEFIDLAKQFNIPIQILSGDQEAKLTYSGVKSLFKTQNGLIIDIGGGSTEYIQVINGEMVDRISLDMGVVRFTERYLKDLSFFEGQKNLRIAIRNELEKNKKVNEFKNISHEVFLAVSGTPTVAASILLNGFNPDEINNFKLKSSDFKFLIQGYCELTLDERLARFPFVEEMRADVLPTGVLILEESLSFFNLNSYQISTRGIRHGLAYSMYNKGPNTSCD